eukprot:gene31118-6251_t
MGTQSRGRARMLGVGMAWMQCEAFGKKEVLCSPGNGKRALSSADLQATNCRFFNPEHELDELDDPFTYAATMCTNDIEAFRRMDNHQQLAGAVARSYSSLTALQQLPVPRTDAVVCADKSEVVSSISNSTAQAVLGKYDMESGVKFVGEILEVGTKKSPAACAAECGLSENCTGFTYIEVPADTWSLGDRADVEVVSVVAGSVVATAQASFAGASDVEVDTLLSTTPINFPQAFKQLYNVNGEPSIFVKDASGRTADCRIS